MSNFSKNTVLWDEISQLRKELDILRYKFAQLDIKEQIETLKYAYSIDNEKYALEQIMHLEPVGYRKSERKLTRGLIEILVSGAVYPGHNEIESQKLLIELAKDNPESAEIIYQKCLKHLDDADEACDFEVYERVRNLLIDVNSDRLNAFRQRCREHKCPDIREVDEDLDNV
ncbi:MAG: hypothetical protein P8P74_14675 [Crocinitomicaceae bacterium]|nr:hypothetical protein [Crocinitomicaceae bacterium]